MTEKKLPYEYDSLEPFIDKETMHFHHDKHYMTYIAKYEAAVKGTELEGKCPCYAIKNFDKVPDNIKTPVRNNGGGAVNHAFFWPLLKKDVAFEGKIKEMVEAKWGSLDKFKEEFTNAALGLFGSGWVWVVLNENELEIITTPNQDSPLTIGKKPVLGLDVWEHAYYLKYKNARPDYVAAFWNVVNWEKVNEYIDGDACKEDIC
ncbi:MAG: superoxide dismutase [Candidatus Woesearchaeota archaeon]